MAHRRLSPVKKPSSSSTSNSRQLDTLTSLVMAAPSTVFISFGSLRFLPPSYCYEHGMSLPGNVSLMVGKRVLRGYVSGIQKVQLEDPDIRPILKKKLKSADRPSRQEIAPQRPATKRYWALSDSLPGVALVI
ncbi:hypothetical protein AVEN_229650-1 [Araneus ventricosus]|uniref:Uncharacterized protein n=1 Tax=Araneus ventricosus TaxID=182803 RepID=A0A4Y1ZUB9_ARAVE|nr:hypothetical protein AVEN_229650-1 [Araneus ventricosus]